jgi:hypothetical protein
MATQKQIDANRANARRSTGPRTATGKQRSSQNAFRHGLSLPQSSDPLVNDVVDAIWGASATSLDQDAMTAASELVYAQLELLRIRSIRSEMMAVIEAGAVCVGSLPRLAALDRYERLANTKRLRASRKLKVG